MQAGPKRNYPAPDTILMRTHRVPFRIRYAVTALEPTLNK